MRCYAIRCNGFIVVVRRMGIGLRWWASNLALQIGMRAICTLHDISRALYPAPRRDDVERRKGEADAARQGAILRGRQLDGFAYLCSPSGRTVQTAGIACAQIAEAVHTDIRLREIGVGDWAGRLRDELPQGTGNDPYMAQYEMAPNGEGIAVLSARCLAFLTDLSGPAVLITHGITSRVIREIVVGPDALSNPSIHGGQGCVYHLKGGVQNLLT
jgi:broad specificity phosphatase PhoE